MTASRLSFFRCRRSWVAVLLLLLAAVGLWTAEQPDRGAGVRKTGQPSAGKTPTGEVATAEAVAPVAGMAGDGVVMYVLTDDAGDSLDDALAAARHRVSALTDETLAALPRNAGVSHFAANPGQDITARFLIDGGVKFESGKTGKSWQGTLTFSGGADAGAWRAVDHRAERGAKAGVVEWYENKVEGIEHGFTLAHRPERRGAPQMPRGSPSNWMACAPKRIPRVRGICVSWIPRRAARCWAIKNSSCTTPPERRFPHK